MSNPTTPFGWQMPTATDLVTDLPADFEVFGQAVATSMQDLLGGTTGQVLAKASNADMDFVWSADAAGMSNPMTTTGDVIYSSPGSTPVRLGIGTANQVLRVNSGATAPEWATPAGGGKVLQVIMASTSTEVTTSSTTYSDTGLTATITPSLATSKVLVLVSQNGLYISGNNTLSAGRLKLVRTSTDIAQITTRASGDNNAIQRFGDTVSIAYLDTPATNSATTYKTTFSNHTAAVEVRFQVDNVPLSTIILMEIGA